MKTHLLLLALFAVAPSRPPEKGCVWETFSDASVGLEASVQRCDFGSRKVDFVAQGRSLAMRYSDSGVRQVVIDVSDRLPDEIPEAAATRMFAAHADHEFVAKCAARPYPGITARKDVQRYIFVPKNRKGLIPDDEVGPPPCGPWGASAENIQYYEVHPTKVFFVRVGMNVPLFDEQTLRSTK